MAVQAKADDGFYWLTIADLDETVYELALGLMTEVTQGLHADVFLVVDEWVLHQQTRSQKN